ncbi:MAG: hypothetical protein HZC13_02205 [Nitrospirae bacterium]|nr:hypothetical protein [Nitrospirota bacterium]
MSKTISIEEARKRLGDLIEDVHEWNIGRKPDEIEALIEEAVKAIRTRKMK